MHISKIEILYSSHSHDVSAQSEVAEQKLVAPLTHTHTGINAINSPYGPTIAAAGVIRDQLRATRLIKSDAQAVNELSIHWRPSTNNNVWKHSQIVKVENARFVLDSSIRLLDTRNSQKSWRTYWTQIYFCAYYGKLYRLGWIHSSSALIFFFLHATVHFRKDFRTFSNRIGIREKKLVPKNDCYWHEQLSNQLFFLHRSIKFESNYNPTDGNFLKIFTFIFFIKSIDDDISWNDSCMSLSCLLPE